MEKIDSKTAQKNIQNKMMNQQASQVFVLYQLLDYGFKTLPW